MPCLSVHAGGQAGETTHHLEAHSATPGPHGSRTVDPVTARVYARRVAIIPVVNVLGVVRHVCVCVGYYNGRLTSRGPRLASARVLGAKHGLPSRRRSVAHRHLGRTDAYVNCWMALPSFRSGILCLIDCLHSQASTSERSQPDHLYTLQRWQMQHRLLRLQRTLLHLHRLLLPQTAQRHRLRKDRRMTS